MANFFYNFALKIYALNNGPREVKILVRTGTIVISKNPKGQVAGQEVSQSEGCLVTRRELLSHPADFGPYMTATR